jgi:hypothetical protein
MVKSAPEAGTSSEAGVPDPDPDPEAMLALLWVLKGAEGC